LRKKIDFQPKFEVKKIVSHFRLEPIKINAAAKPACLSVTPDNSVAMVCRRTVTLWTPSGTLTSTFTHPDFKVKKNLKI